MRKLLYSVLVLALLTSLGCAITNYGVITDDRGDYSGVIRTMHKAYVVPTGQVATIYADGSDELFTMVYQNQYADRTLYTFNNFDPTGAVNFLDQTYCDWRYEGCEIVRARDPRQDWLDDPFDYEFFGDCSGARSLSLLVDQGSRLGECGDRLFSDIQGLSAEFAELPTTTFRGETAYVVPMNAGNTTITLDDTNMPLYGQFTSFLTEDLQLVIPMTPNTKLQLGWLANHVNTNGTRANLAITYGSLQGSVDLAIAIDGINHNISRF